MRNEHLKCETRHAPLATSHLASASHSLAAEWANAQQPPCIASRKCPPTRGRRCSLFRSKVREMRVIRLFFNLLTHAAPEVTYGNWQSALRAEKAERLRTVLRKTNDKPKELKLPPLDLDEKATSSPRFLPPQVLNCQFILYACHVKHPRDVAVCKIDGYGLKVADANDLHEFTSLVDLDVSDNVLQFHQMGVFEQLRTLSMAANQLTRVFVPDDTLLHLHSLDLSFNQLDQDSIVELGNLPHLRFLDLSGNGLVELPLGMCGSARSAPESRDGRRHVRPLFYHLETLILDANRLTGFGAFPALAGLPRLRNVSITRNKVQFVPHLVPDGGASETVVKPFPCLERLDLSENWIAASEDIIEVAEWPNLQELILWGNPLTRQRSRLPKAIVDELQVKRGISVTRVKPPPPKKPAPILTTEQLKQVDMSLPSVAEIPEALLAHQQRYLEYSTTKPTHEPLLPAIMASEIDYSDHAGSTNRSSPVGSVDDLEEAAAPRGPGFFLTETEDDDPVVASKPILKPQTPVDRPGSVPHSSQAQTPSHSARRLTDLTAKPNVVRFAEEIKARRARSPQSTSMNRIVAKYPDFAELFQDDDEPHVVS